MKLSFLPSFIRREVHCRRNHPRRRCFVLPHGEIFDAIDAKLKPTSLNQTYPNVDPNLPKLSKSIPNVPFRATIFLTVLWRSEALHRPRDHKGGPQHVKVPYFVVLAQLPTCTGVEEITETRVEVKQIQSLENVRCETSLQQQNIL